MDRVRFGFCLALVLAVSAWVFLSDLGRYPFIGTEGLRAIVVKEMLERPGYTLPTVHHVPYLRKPPLYAWTTVTLSRAVGRLDEFICRLPSAASAIVLVVLTFVVGERRLGRGTGFAAATFLLANVTVLDYGVRAELDMPFALLCAVSALLTAAAFHGRGARAGLAWVGAYAAALLASMWKGPHVLIFNGLALLVLSRRHRRWDWLWQPGHLLGLIAALAALVTWTVVLSRFGGATDVGRTAAGELFLRLVPHRVDDLLGIIAFPFVTLIATLPASLFFLAGLRNRPTESDATKNPPLFEETPPAHACERSDGFFVSSPLKRVLVEWATNLRPAAYRMTHAAREWARRLVHDPFTEFILVYTVVNLVFLMCAPAKAPRYTLPVFWAIALLGARAVGGRRADDPRSDVQDDRAINAAWRGIAWFIFIAGLAAAGQALLITGLSGSRIATDLSLAPPAWPWWLAGGAGIAFGAWEWARRSIPGAAVPRLIGLLLVTAACKPVMMSAWWPARLASDEPVEPARRIDELLPPGAAVYVLKRDDAPDVAFYSFRRFEFVKTTADVAPKAADQPTAYFLAREEDLEEAGDPHLRPGYRELFRFTRNDRNMILFTMAADEREAGNERPITAPP